MEGSVKERLTGALIFVAAFVVIVSEMFSGPQPESASAPVSVPVPGTADAGPPLRTYSVTLNDAAQPRAEVPPAVVSAPPLAETPAVAPPIAQSPPAKNPAAAAPASIAPAAPDSVVPDSVASASTGDWWVRLGIFASRDNAERLTKKLRAAGFDIDMDKYPSAGRNLFRVRAGPVRDRAEALALQARLAASGSDSVLLVP